MKRSNVQASIEIIVMLDKLNNAKRLYNEATNEEERQKANRIFADCYDWLTNQHIAITYDNALHLWLYGGQY